MIRNDPFEAGLAEPLRDSGKALLVDFDGVGAVWVPKSGIHDDSEVWEKGQEPGMLVVKGWLAELKGWL